MVTPHFVPQFLAGSESRPSGGIRAGDVMSGVYGQANEEWGLKTGSELASAASRLALVDVTGCLRNRHGIKVILF